MPQACAPIFDERWLAGIPAEGKVIVAIFRQAIQDARSRRAPQTEKPSVRENAQRWLRDREAETYWLALAGLPDGVYARLLMAVGLEETA